MVFKGAAISTVDDKPAAAGSSTVEQKMIQIDIAGAISRPGVYSLPEQGNNRREVSEIHSFSLREREAFYYYSFESEVLLGKNCF